MESTVKRFILPVAATLILAGCGSDSDQIETAAQEETGEPTAQTQPRREVRREAERMEVPATTPSAGDAERNIPRIEGSATTEGYGLTMIVDGSSPQAFQQSLELIAQDSTQEQYQRLDSALRYLRAYSPEAWQGTPNLYASLDGMTGEEIIERATNLRRERSGR
jgi:hypothetical protein